MKLFSAVLLLMVICAGCQKLVAADEDKGAAFKPFESLKIGDVSAREFTSLRTGEFASEELHFGARHDFGSVTVISSDGYMLTAGHCLVGQAYFARYSSARVVWRPTQPGDPDLAILKVDAATNASFFEWAPDRVNCVGKSVISGGEHFGSPSAGTLLMIGNTDTKPSITATGRMLFWCLAHSSPLTYGDSGGPLLTTDGHLLGVNVGTKWVQEDHRFISLAICPDPEWLQGIISADRATHVSGNIPTASISAR
jgi:S1-C subfamily serine protease